MLKTQVDLLNRRALIHQPRHIASPVLLNLLLWKAEEHQVVSVSLERRELLSGLQSPLPPPPSINRKGWKFRNLKMVSVAI